MTVVPGLKDFRKNIEYQTVNVIDTLKAACELLEPHGLVMVLEPQISEITRAYFLRKAHKPIASVRQ